MGLERKIFSPDSARRNNLLVQGRGRLPFTSNPPLDLQKEGPTPQDINRAKTITGELSKQEGAVSPPVAFGLGFGTGSLILGTGGFFLAKEVFANPKTTIDIDSFPNSFNPEGSSTIEGLPPQLEQQSDNKVENPEDFKETLKKIFAEVEIIEVPGVISEKDISRLPQEEIDKQFPTAFTKLGQQEDKAIISLRQGSDLSGKPLHDVSYELDEKNKNTLQLQYLLDLRSSSNPDAQIEFTKSYGGFNQADRDAFQGKGYFDTYTFYKVPKGTIIRAPIDGFLAISLTNGQIYKGPEESAGGFIDFQAPNGNTYRLGIVGQRGNSIFVLKSILDAPELTAEFKRKPIGSGTPAKGGQAIFETNVDLDELMLKIFIGKKGEVEKGSWARNTPYVPTNIEFFSLDNKWLTPE